LSARAIFHVAADFPNQDIYPQLVRAVAAGSEWSQTVVAAVRTPKEAEWRGPQLPRVRYDIRHILRPYHRVLFRTKIKLICRMVEADRAWGEAVIMHAHSLYSDGAVARRLHRRYDIPYITAVRNVDLHAFMRFRPDLSMVRDDVLRHASSVVFLSPAYRDAVLGLLPSTLMSSVRAKSHVVPNGVAPFWIENRPSTKEACGSALRVLYVGDLTVNKNIQGLLSAVKLLGAERPTSLTVVGGTREDARGSGLEIDGGVDVDFRGRVTDRMSLLHIYREHHVFAMPSFTETFGVAYIEALSQGLPIVHSAGQGVDGFFGDRGVAERVDPGSPEDIADGIRRVASRLPIISPECVAAAARFDWQIIGQRFCGLYEDALS
jgi:glycosyltransferase involved in cell wall biosynthesis